MQTLHAILKDGKTLKYIDGNPFCLPGSQVHLRSLRHFNMSQKVEIFNTCSPFLLLKVINLEKGKNEG